MILGNVTACEHTTVIHLRPVRRAKWKLVYAMCCGCNRRQPMGPSNDRIPRGELSLAKMINIVGRFFEPGKQHREIVDALAHAVASRSA